MKQTTQRIVRKIGKLKKDLPNNWAKQVGERIGKSPDEVRSYARGERGENDGLPLIVLQELTIIHSEYMNQVENLTA